MQKLHLVGFTTDQKGLILSARRGSRSGSYHVTVDDELAEAVEELRAKQAEAEAEALAEAESIRPSRVESALSVREIQARLRQGRSLNDVAKAAGVDPEWVERFAVPVFAEVAQVIALVQGRPLRRARLGPSLQPIGEALRHNLAERGVSLSPEEFEDAWSARQLADGRWAVRFRFRNRGRDQVLRFDLDEAAGTVVAADRSSAQLGYVTPPEKPASKPRPAPPAPSKDARAQKRATVTVGFRADDGKATSPAARERERANEAMRRAAEQRAAEAEKAAVRRARERAEEQARAQREAAAAEARRLREEKAAEARKERERAAKERERAAAARKKAAAAKKLADQRASEKAAKERKRAAAARKRAAERAKAKAAKQRADQARRAEAALRAAEKRAAAAKRAKASARTAAARSSTSKAPAKKQAGRKAPAPTPRKAQTTPRKVVAKKAATKRATARKVSSPAPARKAPVARVAPATAPAVEAAVAKAPAPKAASDPRPVEPAPVAPRAAARRPVEEPPVIRPAAPPPTPMPARAVFDEDAGGVRILGPAPRPAAATPLLIRAGVVEATSDDGDGRSSAAGPLGNGQARERPPGLRRTRPLRAT